MDFEIDCRENTRFLDGWQNQPEVDSCYKNWRKDKRIIAS